MARRPHGRGESSLCMLKRRAGCHDVLEGTRLRRPVTCACCLCLGSALLLPESASLLRPGLHLPSVAGVVWGREDPEGFIGEELASADLGSAQEGMVVSVCRCWALPQVVCIRQVASVSSRQCLCSAAESQQVAWCVME